MGYTKLHDKNGIISFLDFEKAFDTIRWDVIYDALKLFNFGPKFIDWVQTIYIMNLNLASLITASVHRFLN